MDDLDPPDIATPLADPGGGGARLPPEVRLADHFPTPRQNDSERRERHRRQLLELSGRVTTGERWQLSPQLLKLLRARGLA